jgi:hypothetical protein
MDTIDETGNQRNILIDQKEVWENHTTLGCDKNMVGDDTGHMRKLKHKSDQYAFQIKNNSLNRNQMQLAFNMIYLIDEIWPPGDIIINTKYRIHPTICSRQVPFGSTIIAYLEIWYSDHKN